MKLCITGQSNQELPFNGNDSLQPYTATDKEKVSINFYLHVILGHSPSVSELPCLLFELVGCICLIAWSFVHLGHLEGREKHKNAIWVMTEAGIMLKTQQIWRNCD